ncbi:hypothetical protein Tco_0567836 [Tanacetum coccineum]
MHGDQSPRTLKFQQPRKQSKPCEVYKQSYNAKPKSALECQQKITIGLTKEKMFEFKTKKLEESSSNWKPLHNYWDAITSNLLEDDASNDKYRYNRKGFLEDDDSSDDSILIVDPGWDDYCLQELKLNRPVPLCPEARRARMLDQLENPLSLETEVKGSILTPCKAEDPPEAASQPLGRGKAVYISPPPLPRGRRDWIPLS